MTDKTIWKRVANRILKFIYVILLLGISFSVVMVGYMFYPTATFIAACALTVAVIIFLIYEEERTSYFYEETLKRYKKKKCED